MATLTLCGLALDFCVGYSAIDARRAECNVTVMLAACRRINMNVLANAMLATLRDAGVILEQAL